MSPLFRNSPFNGDISSWDVSSVTSMYHMFRNTPFNGDISSWDVSNVTRMDGMFNAMPYGLGDSYNSLFNKDLSSWNVSKVTDCYLFSNNANSWSLPKPNFTNCSPD